jgi:peptidoglycan hydrolase-like protein with peptidoglycan-binding domain
VAPSPSRSHRDEGGVANDSDRADRRDGAETQPPVPATVLSLQRAVGNAAVAGMVGRRLLARAPGPLTAAQERAAVAAARALLTRTGVRVLQEIVNTTVDGAFGPITAQAVATFQGANALGQTGIVDRATLDALVASAVTNAMHDEAIFLVADWENLDIVSGTLTVRHDPSIAGVVDSNMTRQGGNLRVITIGTAAFASSTRLGNAIRANVTAANPAAAAPAAAPAALTRAEATAATTFNRSHFRDRRSAEIIQSQCGDVLTGAFTNDTSQRITVIQAAAGLTPDGKVGRQTLRELVRRLDAAGERDAAIRLIIDFHRFNENGLLDIAFDPTVTTSNAETGSAQIPGPTTIRVGPSAFTQGYEGLVHTIAHELEHTRQRRIGIQNRNLREFLGERIEILSVGMEEENFAGFLSDATRALAQFNAMPAALRRQNWSRFVDVRTKVRSRFAGASAADQAANAALLANYNAVVRPP